VLSLSLEELLGLRCLSSHFSGKGEEEEEPFEFELEGKVLERGGGA
jgi:hypothetical protein